ncbi:ABC transporter [Myriangium duriaei CBS 260.36]|uniref:ABC transporter n=1 Tax=Myriangium duriaei CBS 260.36 TaxID=1168546 RepID=A0A9P4J9I6_9PEZI|nr:ABC transporter [Myriangium duriaei CBS 260.36]
MQSLNGTSVDRSFGPWAGPEERGGFDFTLRFEESILVIPLQCLFLAFLPLRTWQLLHKDMKFVPGLLQPAKIGALTILLLTNISFLILYCVDSRNITHTSASWPAQSLVIVADVGLLILSWLEHGRSLRPSFLVVVYLFLSALLDLPRVRTLWMLGSSSGGIAVVITVNMVIRVLALVLESIEKRSLIFENYAHVAAATTTGPISNAFFIWLWPLFRKGYSNILTLSDMFLFERELESEVLYKQLAATWERSPNKTAPSALCNAWFKTFAGPVLMPVFPKILVLGFTYVQPFLIDSAVRIAATPQTQPYNNWSYGLIGAFIIAYAGLAISTGQYTWRVSVAGSALRGSMISLIYQELLRAEVMSPDMQPAAALTMMNTDIETIVAGVHHVHELWGSIAEIAIADYLIYKQLGAACAMPLSLAVVLLIFSVYLALPTGKAQAAWIQASQDRVTATSGVLGSVKWLKFSGLTDMAFSTLRQLRLTELEVSLKFRKLLGRSLLLLIFMPVWSPILTFSVSAGLSANGHGGGRLSLSSAFTSLSVLLLMSTPLTAIISALPTVAAAYESCGRVQSYLNSKKCSDSERDSEFDGLIEGGDEKKDLKAAVHPPVLPMLQLGKNFDSVHELDDMLRDKKKPDDADVVASVRGHFAWSPELAPVLNISQWSIYRGQLNLVLGPVGCGKSTLMKCVLGELSAFHGDVWTGYGGTAYCDQKPWLPNEPVRDVIVGDSTFDLKWYRMVVDACALEHDIKLWPEGDQTLPGTQGVTMSGGQKQRISLARAVYARREFTVLDDVFSGLDSATEERVFGALLAPGGLLRGKGMTVVLASSNYRRAPQADKVIRLSAQGQIVESSIWGEIKDGDHDSDDDLDTSEPTPEPEVATRVVTKAVEVEEDPRQALQDHVPDPLELETSDATRRLGDSAMYVAYLRATGYFAMAGFMLGMIIYGFCGSFPAVWLGWWAKDAALDPNKHLGKWLGVYVVLGVGAFVAAAIGARILLVIIINKTGIYFHDVLTDIVSRAPMSYHAVTDTGTTLNRFSQDLQLIDMELPAAIFGVATCLSYALAQLVIMSVQMKYMTATLPFLALVFYVLQRFYLRTSRQLRLLEIEHKAPLFTQVIETIDGLVTIRAYKWEERSMKKMLQVLDDSRRPNYLLTCVQCWLNLTLDLVVTVIAVIFVTLTSTIREKIGAEVMGVGLTNVLGLSGSAQSFVSFWVALEVALGAVARISRFKKNIEVEPVSEDMLRNSQHIQWPTEGAVEFHDVSASYTATKQCLSNINMSIKPGQKVALCGRTGSGKSSVTLALLRMLDLDSGSITVDGYDLTTLPHDFVRTHLVAHPQEVYIMDGTLRLNVDPMGVSDDESIKHALKRVQLWDRLANEGLETEVSKAALSPGEAQLLAFARTLVRNSKILIVDELTSSLDADTTEVIDEILRDEFDEWTVIAVVHQLSSVLDFDRVAILDAGRLVEFDEPRKLLDQESQFKGLWELSVGPIDRQKLGLPERKDKQKADDESTTGSTDESTKVSSNESYEESVYSQW